MDDTTRESCPSVLKEEGDTSKITPYKDRILKENLKTDYHEDISGPILIQAERLRGATERKRWGVSQSMEQSS